EKFEHSEEFFGAGNSTGSGAITPPRNLRHFVPQIIDPPSRGGGVLRSAEDGSTKSDQALDNEADDLLHFFHDRDGDRAGLGSAVPQDALEFGGIAEQPAHFVGHGRDLGDREVG